MDYNGLIRDRTDYQDHIYICHVDNVSGLYLKSQPQATYPHSGASLKLE